MVGTFVSFYLLSLKDPISLPVNMQMLRADFSRLPKEPSELSDGSRKYIPYIHYIACMGNLKLLNKGIMFLLEICMLLSLSYWGFHNHSSIASYLYGIGLPVLAALLWGILAAPKSKNRLRMPYRVFFSIGMFWISGILLYETGLTLYAIVFMIVAFVSGTLAYVFER